MAPLRLSYHATWKTASLGAVLTGLICAGLLRLTGSHPILVLPICAAGYVVFALGGNGLGVVLTPRTVREQLVSTEYSPIMGRAFLFMVVVVLCFGLDSSIWS